MLYETWSPVFTSSAHWMEELQTCVTVALRKVDTASDSDFCQAYRGLVSQLESVFRAEEDHMDGMDPAEIRAHREQHARVLRGLHCAHSQVLDGDLELGREIVRELLPRWLGMHLCHPAPPRDRATDTRSYRFVTQS